MHWRRGRRSHERINAADQFTFIPCRNKAYVDADSFPVTGRSSKGVLIKRRAQRPSLPARQVEPLQQGFAPTLRLENMMINIYAFATPNSVRVPIALEELGLPYAITAINVRKGEQKQPSYLAINPNGKVPVLVDPDGPDGKPLTLS
jgi:hypothetical protein